jgi:hypothetical protein
MAAALPPALPTLAVNDTGATDAAAVALAAALERAGCALATLELGGNGVALNGARALARALARSATMRSVFMTRNELRIRDMQDILREVPADGSVAVELQALDMCGRDARPARTQALPSAAPGSA